MKAVEETSDGSSSEEDELSLLSRRVNQLYKQRQRKFRNPRRSENRNESSSRYRKYESSSGHRISEGSSGNRKRNNKDIIFYECDEQGHYKSDFPKLQKENPKKKFGKEKKKRLMDTWDDSDTSEADSESDDERANIALMVL